MALKLRGESNLKLTIEELDGNFTYLEQLALSGTSSGSGATGPVGATGPTGATGPAGSGSTNTFTMSAHPSLTLSDIGKWVMSYSDPDFIDFMSNAGPTTSLDSYTGSHGVCKVVELTGTQSGSSGFWVYDASASYNGSTLSSLDTSSFIFRVASMNDAYFYKKNMGFQLDDPYLSSIIPSMTYSNYDNGYGTVSYPGDDLSAAILLEYYCNNGFPTYNGEFQYYTADSEYGDTYPYHIQSTQSVFESATRVGTELTMELSPYSYFTEGSNNVYVYYHDANLAINQVQPVVAIKFPKIDTYQFQILGILDGLSSGVATITVVPEVYEFQVFEGTPNIGGTTSIISVVPPSNLSEFSIFLNYWVPPTGGVGLINLLSYLSTINVEKSLFEILANCPIYTPISTGVIGDVIKFKKITPILS
jgi:hypothetical protein